MKTAREMLEKALDKYSFTRGYPCGGTESRDNAVSNILSDLAEIVLARKKENPYDVGHPYFQEVEEYNQAIDHIASLFEAKD